MPKKMIIILAVTLTVAIAAVGAFYAYTYMSPKVEVEEIPLDYNHTHLLFSIHGKPYVLIYGVEEGRSTSYYCEPLQGSVDISNAEKLATLPGVALSTFVKVMGGKVYIVASTFENNTDITTIIVANDEMEIRSMHVLRDMQVTTFTLHNGTYFLFGQNATTAKLLRSEDLDNFTEISEFSRNLNTRFILSSYFVSSKNHLYLAYSMEYNQTQEKYRAVLEEVNRTGTKEIYVSTDKTWKVFAYSENGKIYFYKVGEDTSLRVFNATTGKQELSKTMEDMFVFYHDSNTGLTFSLTNDFEYSKDGIHFTGIYPRKGLTVDTTEKNIAVMEGKTLYVIVTGGPMNFKLLKMDMSAIL